MTTTDFEVKEFLESAREATLELARCKRQLRQLEDVCRNITSHTDAIGGGKRSGPADGNLAKLCDARQQLIEAVVKSQTQIGKVGKFIDRMEGPDMCRIVLRLRYLEFRRWSDAQRALEQVGVFFSERQILRRHAEALELAEALWQKEKETECFP